jgi:hypothetical protein
MVLLQAKTRVEMVKAWVDKDEMSVEMHKARVKNG